MDDNHQITIDISAELAALVDDAVDAGGYASASEVVRQALLEWADRHARASSADHADAAQREHDTWFRAAVQGSMDRLGKGVAGVASHEDQTARWRDRRAELLAKVETGK